MAIFEKNILISSADLGPAGQLKPHVILKRFERTAIDHVTQYHLGENEMVQKGLLWVVTQTKVVYLKPITAEQAIKVRTWSLPPRHSMAQREYQMIDESGEVVVIGASQWVLMDKTTRKATLKMEEVLQVLEFGSKSNFENHLRFLRPFPRQGDGILIEAVDEDIDFNDHVNNSRYAAYMMKALPDPTLHIESFTINYRKEMRLGEALKIYITETENGFAAEGYNTQGNVLSFIGAVKLRKTAE